MDVPLFFPALIVSFGLAPVESKNKIVDDPRRIQENFRSFFDSIRENDEANIGTLRNFLGHEVAREQHAFDSMKEKLRSARQRNAHWQKNPYSKRGTAFKREVQENKTGPDVATLVKPAQELKKLPIGIRDIRQILEGGYIYVDKTGMIYDLILEHSFDNFMVRPRGFGKTLLISTLEQIFKGNKALFKGTAIHRSKYKWVEFPVLRFDFFRMECREPAKFETTLKKAIKKMSKDNGIVLTEEVELKPLLTRLAEEWTKKSGQRLVILVDEYDAPVTNSIDLETAKKCQDIVYNFTATVASLSDDYLQFTFFTGVNGLDVCGPQNLAEDHLVDITLHPRYATMMGFTQDELELNFAQYGGRVPAGNKYRFSKYDVSVYNPLTVLTHLNVVNANGTAHPSYEIQIPSFLVHNIRKHPQVLFSLRKSAAEGHSLRSPVNMSRSIDLEPFLFQMGFFTIRGHNQRDNRDYYEVDFCNEQLKNNFFRVVLKGLTDLDPIEIGRGGDKIKRDLVALDADSFMAALSAHISAIPGQHRHVNSTLENYRAIFYLLMENYGFEMKVELGHSSTKLSDVIAFFKFTLDETADMALRQVLETQKDEKGKMLCFGINFSTKTANIRDWKAILVDGGQVVKIFPAPPV